VLHIFVLLIHFAMPAPSDTATKEIAVSIRPSTDQVEHADFLAQANQKGSGKFHDSHRMSSDMPKAMPDQSQVISNTNP
jgi:protein TonB